MSAGDVWLSEWKPATLSFPFCSPSAWHYISIRLLSTVISTDCSLHSVLKKHWKVISSPRTWPGLQPSPSRDPPGQHTVERGNTVGKLKERNYNSFECPWERGRAETERERGRARRCGTGRPRDISLWDIPGPGLVNSPKLVFGASDPDCDSAIKICHLVVFIKLAEQHLHVCYTHTHTHARTQLFLCRYKAVAPQQIKHIVDTRGDRTAEQNNPGTCHLV